MKRSWILVLLAWFLSIGSETKAQSQEFGIAVGLSEFWGDLGGGPGPPNVLRHSLVDFDFSQTKYVVGFIYRVNFTGYSALRFNFLYARIDGSDSKAKLGASNYSDKRYYRNLDFFSSIGEISIQYERNLMRYEVSRRRFRFTPYVLFGAGVFTFNPKAKGSGEKLAPLRTEGQGSVLYPDRQPYSLWQPVVLLGLGLKYNVSDNWSIGFEYGHRITFTDYIDDVSKTYVDYRAFEEIHGDNTTAINAALLANRSYELVLDDTELALVAGTTAAGQQRGDPHDYDHYIFAGALSLTYTISKGKVYCPKF